MTNKANRGGVSLETKYRPQDDFYNYVCCHWQQANALKKGQQQTSYLKQLTVAATSQLDQIFQDWPKSPATQAANGRLVLDLLTTYNKKEQLSFNGLKTLKKTFDELVLKTNQQNLVGQLAKFHRLGVSVFWDFQVNLDLKTRQKFLFEITPAKLTWPANNYFQKQSRNDYQQFLKTYWLRLNYLGQAVDQWPTLKRSGLKTIWRLEKSLATWQKILPVAGELVGQQIDWASYCRQLGLKRIPKVIVAQASGYLSQVGQYLKRAPIEDLRLYLTWRLFLTFGHYLDETLAKINFIFYKKLNHQGRLKTWPTIEARGLVLVKEALAEVIGGAYTQRYLAPTECRSIANLAEAVRQQFGRRLKTVAWLNSNSRQAATAKLQAIEINIGQPASRQNYQQLKVVKSNLLQTVFNLNQFLAVQSLGRLGKKPNRKNFGPASDSQHSSEVINAWSSIPWGNINLPAAICQSPFYQAKNSRRQNLARLGFIIGHELAHHFLGLGLNYSSTGQEDWLSPKERYQQRQAIEPLVELLSDLGFKNIRENVFEEILADLAGLLVVCDLIKKSQKNPKYRRQAYQQLFVDWAFLFSENARRSHLKKQNKFGSHPSHRLRVNLLVSQVPAFYEAFDLKPGDRLYLPKDRRLTIWS